MEMSVSIVAVRWRSPRQASRWNGHAPQSTTGVARKSATSSQPANCSGPIMERARTGTASTVEIRRRMRRPRASPASGRGAPGSVAP